MPKGRPKLELGVICKRVPVGVLKGELLLLLLLLVVVTWAPHEPAACNFSVCPFMLDCSMLCASIPFPKTPFQVEGQPKRRAKQPCLRTSEHASLHS